jgi:hypothetical protein
MAGMLAAALLITGGVFAKNGWFPAPLAKSASSSWNPLAAPLPTPTPQLSREYVYAGSRLLAQVDANAQESPPADLAVWRPTTGGWWVLGGQGSLPVNYNWGTNGDDPVEGDYDSDGKTDFAVFRPGNNTWYIVDSSRIQRKALRLSGSTRPPSFSPIRITTRLRTTISRGIS